MNILLISGKAGSSACFSVDRRGVTGMALVLFGLIPGLAAYAGYRLGVEREPAAGTFQAELAAQRQSIAEAKVALGQNLNALAARLGEMQARVVRLDDAGQRLTRLAGLTGGEFDFTQPPAQGGPEEQDEPITLRPEDFLAQVDQLDLMLQDRSEQLEVLEAILMDRNVQAEFSPAGRPSTGLISSTFGVRADPFSGRMALHKGVDLAGPAGADVIAVAAGVVTWSGERSGYGNLVEISHGNGVATRYGHNQENLVKNGETVRKGQVIARMGSTGRSTGPHVHFEVLREGRQVDPMNFLGSAS